MPLLFWLRFDKNGAGRKFLDCESQNESEKAKSESFRLFGEILLCKKDKKLDSQVRIIVAILDSTV